MRGIQPSNPRPFTTNSRAPASAFTSCGRGWNTCASWSGPTSVVTATRSPPTSFTTSPRMLKLATTGTGAAQASTGHASNALQMIFDFMQYPLFQPAR